MKKYQLIKWYPGLPANASRAVQISGGWYEIMDNKEVNIFDTAEGATIENSPEFWEEIKTFSFITDDNIKIYDKNQVVYAYNLTSKNVGTVLVENTWNKEDNPGGWLYFSTAEARWAYIEALKPQPVIITQDGVKLFINQDFWYVNTKDFAYGKVKIYINKVNISENFITFSTKGKAKEWILMNQPLITLKDIMEPSSTPYNVNLSDSNKGKLRAIAENRLSLYNTKP